MSASFMLSIKARRTYYDLTNASTISDTQIRAIVETAVTHVPSPFNVQSSRAVIVTGASHRKLWKLVRKEFIKSLGETAPGRNGALTASLLAELLKRSEAKIAGCAASYGTVLFFEDSTPLDALAKQIPPLAPHFPMWSANAAGMLQFAVWAALEAEGLGASLQHHAARSPEIAAGIRSAFALPEAWKSTGLMPFGVPVGPPGHLGRGKTFKPIEDRVEVFHQAFEAEPSG
ncbi:hypothetical protein HWV62_1801 [Athelia sp. TMB]|nr:hypothetical protein HWV62_1801 [Athelia sp. TMB]